jgi:hypothetical protein
MLDGKIARTLNSSVLIIAIIQEISGITMKIKKNWVQNLLSEYYSWTILICTVSFALF